MKPPRAFITPPDSNLKRRFVVDVEPILIKMGVVVDVLLIWSVPKVVHWICLISTVDVSMVKVAPESMVILSSLAIPDRLL
jgi:hypothetical protein